MVYIYMPMYMLPIIALAQEVSEHSGNRYLPLMLGCGVVLLSFFLMLRSHKRIRRSQPDRSISVRERVELRSRQQCDMNDQIRELMAELADLARQVNGQLDTRMAKLDILLRRADETLARLAETTPANTDSVANADSAAGTSTTANHGAAAAATIAVDPGAMSHLEATSDSSSPPGLVPDPTVAADTRAAIAGTLKVEKIADSPPVASVLDGALPNEGTSVADGSVSAGMTAGAKEGTEAIPEESAPDKEGQAYCGGNSQANREVVELARQGLGSVEIARQLKRPVGEIELILALKKKKS